MFFFILSHSLYSLHCICCFNCANIHNVLIVIHILNLNFFFPRFQKVMTLPKGSFQQWMEILLGWEHSAANEYISTITCCPLLFVPVCVWLRDKKRMSLLQSLVAASRGTAGTSANAGFHGIPASSVCAYTALEKKSVHNKQSAERKKADN